MRSDEAYLFVALALRPAEFPIIVNAPNNSQKDSKHLVW